MTTRRAGHADQAMDRHVDLSTAPGVAVNAPAGKAVTGPSARLVASWIYVFGVLAIAAFLVIFLTGLGLSFAGPSWYHTSSGGHSPTVFISGVSNCSSCSWWSICGESSGWPPGAAVGR